MKTLKFTSLLVILSIVLLSCKKESNESSAPSNQNTTASTPQNTVQILFTPSQAAKFSVNMNYKSTVASTDSVYTMPMGGGLLNLQDNHAYDSLRFKWRSAACATCIAAPCNATLTVNGIVKQTWVNDTGNVYYYFKRY